MSSLRVGSLLPHIRIAILSRGDNAVRTGGPVNRRDELVVLCTVLVLWHLRIVLTTYLGQDLSLGPVVALTVEDLHVVGVQADSDPCRITFILSLTR